MTSLKVVALISGGKDSLFSILHCTKNGHEVVALANLHPPLHSGEVGIDDLDSFMYQTIGHAVIPLYEQALGLPLYRQEIAGSAVSQNKSYGLASAHEPAEEDETESLIPLLLKVKETHPEINAVSTGAILSDYQRTRVESVALRLGLVPLSFLWQWPTLPPHSQTSLLEDMAAIGQDSRIVKVASGGLDESFLWQNVADTRTLARLTKAASRFGAVGDGAVLGEGGEYETLAIQGPAPLWKARIVVDDDKREVVKGEAGSFTLRLSSPRVEQRDVPAHDVAALRTPPLFDERMRLILVELLAYLQHPHEGQAVGERTRDVGATFSPPCTYTDDNPIHYFGRTSKGTNAASQMHSIMLSLTADLGAMQPKAGPSRIVYTSIILRNMTDFADVNTAYGSYLTEPLPPARVTLACADVLPDECAVMAGFTVTRPQHGDETQVKEGLHVQSRSYWAPANIGPYSQSITAPAGQGQGKEAGDVVYVAGQIPLEPASMQLSSRASDDVQAKLAHQTVLALQHLVRIGHVVKVDHWLAAIAFVVVAPDQAASRFKMIVSKAWESLHTALDEIEEEASDDEGFDVWHLSHGRGNIGQNVQPHERYITGHANQNGKQPPLWVIAVDSLPRGASVEWVAYGTTGNGPPVSEIYHLQYLINVFRQRIIDP